MIVGMLLMTGCYNEDFSDVVEEQQTVSEGMMPVHLQFNLSDAVAVTRSSLVSGTEIDVHDIKMLCFNQLGQFLGMYPATNVQRTSTTDPDIGTIDGEVDDQTTMIHFIANCENLVVSQANNYLRQEAELIKDKALTIDYNSPHITYWGYHREPDATSMKNFLNPGVTNNNTVYLLRDRVKVVAQPISQQSLTQNGIETIEWTVSNGLTKAYLIPWKTDRSGDELLSSTPITITPYDKADAARYGAEEVDETRFEPFDADHPQFMFEDLNQTPGNYVKIIFRVKYTNESGYKYHVIRMMDSEGTPFNLTRNKIYKVEITSLRNNRNAIGSFSEALATTGFSNDAFASVSELVSEVTDGDYTLSIVGGTTKQIQNSDLGTGRTYTFEFEYYENGNQGTNVSGIDASNFRVSGLSGWEDFATNISVGTYTNGKVPVTITLKNDLSNTLQTGSLQIYDKAHSLYRNVNFYAITEFTYADGPSWRKMDNATYGNYELKFKIPGNYPAGLYPITLIFGTRTLTPYSDTSVTGTSGEFEVAVESTGTSGWNYPSGNANTWNDGAATWNYVYKYKIMTKPTDDEGEYLEDDVEYTIYFRDDRSSIAQANRPGEVGLYFEVENFGRDSRRLIHGTNTVQQ